MLKRLPIALTFDPRPQIMQSGVQKYNKCMHYSVDISVNLRSKDDKRHTIFHSISGT